MGLLQELSPLIAQECCSLECPNARMPNARRNSCFSRLSAAFRLSSDWFSSLSLLFSLSSSLFSPLSSLALSPFRLPAYCIAAVASHNGAGGRCCLPGLAWKPSIGCWVFCTFAVQKEATAWHNHAPSPGTPGRGLTGPLRCLRPDSSAAF